MKISLGRTQGVGKPYFIIIVTQAHYRDHRSNVLRAIYEFALQNN
jgi:hypothetical protein